MIVKKIFTQDLQIAKSLINKDEMVTRKYFYQQCYPLFKSIYDNYYTDCANCKEFIDEIYIVVLAPSKATGMAISRKPQTSVSVLHRTHIISAISYTHSVG